MSAVIPLPSPDREVLDALAEAEAEAEAGVVVADEDKVKRSAAEVLVNLALERYSFGCTEDGDGYAVALPAGHVVRMLAGGQVSLRTELAAAYRAKTGKVAAQQALADAMLVLAGIAQEAEPEPVALRVAQTDNGVWIDLGDKAERVAFVGPGGWHVTTSTPGVRFRRTKLTGALPVPEPGAGTIQLVVHRWLGSLVGDRPWLNRYRS